MYLSLAIFLLSNRSQETRKESHFMRISSAKGVQSSVLFENSVLISSDTLDDDSCSIGSSLSNTKYHTVTGEGDADAVIKGCSEVTGPCTKCIIGGVIENLPDSGNSKPLFLSKGWREFLCRCGKCSDLYAQRRFTFLLEKEDSIAEYEKMGEPKRNENIQKLEGAELNFMNNLGHVEKMEILSGIADMKNEIFSFLESSDPSKPVTTADIQQLFENLAKKRKRSD